MINKDKVFSVTEINQYVEAVFNEAFSDYFWLKGEISDISQSSTGHVYLTISDDKSRIQGIIWKYRKDLIYKGLKKGKEVLIKGKFNVYVPGGSYSIIIDNIELYGEGLKQLKKIKLKKKLKKKGYFDKSIKKNIPFLPKKVGIVTSIEGAAVSDILKVLKRRNENVDVIISSATVQGDKAPSEIARAIKLQNEYDRADVLIVARGGGSSDDLSAFDSEKVANAIYDSHIPVITAIGHEIDYTIADLTADERAETPSSAAEKVIKKSKDLREKIQNFENLISKNLKYKIERYKQEIHNLKERLTRNSPDKILNDIKISVDDCSNRLIKEINKHFDNQFREVKNLKKILLKEPEYYIERAKALLKRLKTSIVYLSPKNKIKTKQKEVYNHKSKMIDYLNSIINQKRSRWEMVSIKLRENSPLRFFEKGYSLILRDGEIINSIKDVQTGDLIVNELKDGQIESRIVKLNKGSFIEKYEKGE